MSTYDRAAAAPARRALHGRKLSFAITLTRVSLHDTIKS
jgi:hypothetical protein